jgi:hypothetical protein
MKRETRTEIWLLLIAGFLAVIAASSLMQLAILVDMLEELKTLAIYAEIKSW